MSLLKYSKYSKKIAGRKRPALVDPVHKVRQGYALSRFTLLSSRSVPGAISNFHLAECGLPHSRLIFGRRKSVFCQIPGRFTVGRVSPATSRVNFRSSECVPSCPVSISGRQRVFRHVPGRLPVNRVCSPESLVYSQLAELAGCVPPRPGSISGQQNMFCPIPGQFPGDRRCSATSRVNFWSAEYVSPRPGLTSGWQSVFHHVLVDLK